MGARILTVQRGVMFAIICATVSLQLGAQDLAGTYEIDWPSVNTATEQPTTARLVLVLSSSPLSASALGAMDSGHGELQSVEAPRACWRVIEGTAPMVAGWKRGTSTSWKAVSRDSAIVGLWYIVDAGSWLNFKLVGDNLRGELTSQGYMPAKGGGNLPRVLRNRVTGHRVGKPDVDRCIKEKQKSG